MKRLCACGCGKLTNDHRRYINHHHPLKGENNPFYGKIHSKKTRKIIKEKRKLQVLSEETKLKIGASCKGNFHTEETKEVLRKMRLGSLNPNYGKVYTEEQKRSFGSRGEKHPNWKGGISRFPYAPDWDNYKRNSIKERDGNICLNPNCSKTNTVLTVHHIDYNKQNCDDFNLITLCNVCNIKANYNRQQHKLFYQQLIEHLYGKKYPRRTIYPTQARNL